MLGSIYDAKHEHKMPVVSRFQIAKPDIAKYFDGREDRVYSVADLALVLDEQREFWRLTKSTTLQSFIDDLSRKSNLREVRLPFPEGGIHGWTWGEVPILEAIQSLKPIHYSHYTALRVHGLTEQVPKTIYLTNEKKNAFLKEARDLYDQSAIDYAFTRPPRASKNEVILNGERYILLKGTGHDELGTEEKKINWGGSRDLTLRVTTLERTLIDIAVRPFYSGGVAEVAKAYENARSKGVSINKLSALLSKMNYGYPYHQAIGYYLARGGYGATQLDMFRDRQLERDFYLTHQMSQSEYVPEWRLHIPKGF